MIDVLFFFSFRGALEDCGVESRHIEIFIAFLTKQKAKIRQVLSNSSLGLPQVCQNVQTKMCAFLKYFFCV